MISKKHAFLTTLFCLNLGVPSNILMAAENNTALSSYISPDTIALDPQLLTLDDISNNAAATAIMSETQPAVEVSPLERSYTNRLQKSISQFGYDLITPATTEPARGAVQDSYVLESGDEISVLMRGTRTINANYTIADDGTLAIAELPPINAAGKSIKSVRDELGALTSQYYNTDIFISVSKTRQISVTVSGLVNRPGQITLATYNTALDALGLAGGVNKNGTLRQIKIIRNNHTSILDLYGVLVYGSATADISLRDGDRILVGPIGPNLAISGAVKRPAIYEILPAAQALWHDKNSFSQKLSLSDLMDLAGGTMTPARTRYLRLNVDNKSTDAIGDIPNPHDRIFGDGDILFVNQIDTASQRMSEGSITLTGHTSAKGLYALAESPSLAFLLKDKSIFGDDIYPLIGLIERWNKKRLSKEFIPFSPLQIINHKTDVTLNDSDRVILFSTHDIKSLQLPHSDDSQHLEDATPHTPIKLSRIDSDTRNVLIEHAVFLRGAIRSAGAYPVFAGTTLDELLSVAGGPSLEANTKNIEITQLSANKSSIRSQINLASTPASLVALNPGDTVRLGQNFRKIEDRHVVITGEVKNPGSYDLIPGDTLSSLLKRVGGLSDDAYAEGTIFSRKSERLREEQQYKSQALALELSLANAIQHHATSDKKPNDQELSMARSLIAELKNANAVGRITVESDPQKLETNPELDILLESGDRIYIPKRPLTVRVSGEVLSPASLQFRTGKNPRDYINEAGGFAYNADEDRAFAIYPDGSAQPLSVSAWNHQASFIPPGSTIIVPRDPKPLTFIDGAKDVSLILANLATAAIFADDLANDDD